MASVVPQTPENTKGLYRLRKNTFIFFPTFREAFFFCGAAVFQR
jgi:hypothetical protein